MAGGRQLNSSREQRPKRDVEFKVREVCEDDVGSLLRLMEGLAEFEGYRDQFCVTESDLIARGIGARRQFTSFVAENSSGKLIGMAVCYPVPFTFDLTPELILKELYVQPGARGCGVGVALMTQVVGLAKSLGCRRLKWLVLPDNDRAKQFYSEIGAQQDVKWENWQLAVSEFSSLQNETAGPGCS